MRSPSSCRKRRLLAALCAGLLAVASAGAQGPTPLFGDAGVAAGTGTAAVRDGVRRARTVRVNRAAMAELLRADAAVRPPVVFNVFPDVAVAIARERVETGPRGERTWVGHVEGDRTSLVSLTWTGRTLSGGLVTAGRAFELRPAGDGVAVAIERDLSVAPLELAPLSDDQPGHGLAATAPLTATPTAPVTIDILVLFTPAARAQAGGLEGIAATMANAVAVTNTAFTRSGVHAAVRAVSVEELPYVESANGLVGDLLAIDTHTMAGAVEVRRAQLGADLVALVTGRSTPVGGCGVARLGPTPGATHSVSEQTCLYAGQWSFTHELAHNLGANHAPGDSIPECVPPACAYREGPIRTLMAYARQDSPPRVLNFSSSLVREPAGIGAPTGTSLQDNARRINETAAVVAAYQRAVAPAPPRQFTAAVDGTTVTLTWLPPDLGPMPAAYLLEVGNAPGLGNLLRTSVAAAPLVVPGVPPGRYYARLRSVAGASASPPTEDAVIQVAAGCTPPGPTALQAQLAGGRVLFQWSVPTGTGPFTYTLGAGSVPGGVDRGVFAMASATAFAVQPPPGRYYVKVRAANACGVGAISNEVLVVVP